MRGLLEGPAKGPQDLTVRGLPSGTRVAATFLPGPLLGSALHPLIEGSALGLAFAADGSPPLLALIPAAVVPGTLELAPFRNGSPSRRRSSAP